MHVVKDTVVTLRQRVTDPAGAVIDDGARPVQYLHGGYDAIFAKVEAALDGKGVGDAIRVTLEPEDAYGLADPARVVAAPLEAFANPPAVGDEVERDFGGVALRYRVVSLDGGTAVLDANPPLAGMTLVFSATVADVRPASPEEVAAEVASLGRAVAGERMAGRAFARARAEAEAESEAAALAEAEAAGLVETAYVPQLGTRIRFVFRSQTHKLCWLAPLFLLPAVAAWLGYRGWEATCGVVVALWLVWTFFAPMLIRMAIDRWGERFLFFDFSPNLVPSPLERGIVNGGQIASVLTVLAFTVLGLFRMDHLSELWSLLGVDVAILFALGVLLMILLPFLVMVLTAFRVRPVIDKAPGRARA